MVPHVRSDTGEQRSVRVLLHAMSEALGLKPDPVVWENPLHQLAPALTKALREVLAAPRRFESCHDCAQGEYDLDHTLRRYGEEGWALASVVAESQHGSRPGPECVTGPLAAPAERERPLLDSLSGEKEGDHVPCSPRCTGRSPRGPSGFSWKEVDPGWQTWTPEQYANALCHPRAQEGFKSDFDAMVWCDVCVVLQPCGPSAAMEGGWCVGSGRFTVVHVAGMREPDLMYAMADAITLTDEELLGAVSRHSADNFDSCR